MSSFLNPIPMNLDTFLKKNGTNTVLSNDTPAAPGGASNITWQSDQFGNISGYISGGGGGGNTFGPADYDTTNPGEFTFPDPVVVNAVNAIGPTTITDTGGNGGFFVTTDSNSGGISLQATGFSGISLNAQHTVSVSSGGSSDITVSPGGSILLEGSTVVTATTTTVPLVSKIAFNATSDAIQVQDHLGNPLSRVNSVGDFCLTNTVGQPSDSPVAGATRFDSAASKLWIYNGTAWVGTVLS